VLLGGLCAPWQLVHVECPATTCIPPSFAAAWHDPQSGRLAGPAGPAGASGPCARWHDAHATGAWGPLFFSAWQVAHWAFGARLTGCAS
jgi:hypothetical protein